MLIVTTKIVFFRYHLLFLEREGKSLNSGISIRHAGKIVDSPINLDCRPKGEGYTLLAQSIVATLMLKQVVIRSDRAIYRAAK